MTERRMNLSIRVPALPWQRSEGKTTAGIWDDAAQHALAHQAFLSKVKQAEEGSTVHKHQSDQTA